MSVVTEKKRAEAFELMEMLGTLDVRTPAMPVVTDGLRNYLELDSIVSYLFRAEEHSASLDWLHYNGPVDYGVAMGCMRNYAATTTRRAGFYDIVCPEPGQRNLVKSSMIYATTESEIRAAATTHGVDASEMEATVSRIHWLTGNVLKPMRYLPYQIRVLICHGATLMGWVGGAQGEPTTRSQEHCLQMLVPALQSRCYLEESVRQAGFYRAGLEALLGEIGAAAFIVDGRGRVQFANTVARQDLADDPDMRRRIAEACRWPEPAGEFVIFRLRAPGMADHRLVRLRTSNPAKLPVDLAATRWGLTRRQADVVAEVTRGATNKEIAATLGISEKTVGHHIGAALAKAGVATRTELVASVADCNPK